MTFDLCGTSSKTNLADHLRRENRKRTSQATFYHFQYPTSFVSLFLVVNAMFNISPLCHHSLNHFRTVDRLEPLHSIIYTPSAFLLCLYAITWTDIVSSEPWPTTASLLPDDHALRPGHLPPLRVLHHFSAHPAGHLRLLHPTDRSFYNWT